MNKTKAQNKHARQSPAEAAGDLYGTQGSSFGPKMKNIEKG